MKKHFQIIGVITLIWFSFFCTEKTSLVIKNNDEIMIMINQEKDKYNTQSTNSIIDNDTIIPGISGMSVNIEESYKKMKRIGSYNPTLYVYDTLKPDISVYNNYDKFIIGGNKKEMSVYFIFRFNNSENLKQVISILENNNVTASFLYDKVDKTLYEELKVLDKYDILVNQSTLDTKFNSNIYCYNKNKDFDFLDLCVSKKYFSILPEIYINSNPYANIKNNLKPGLIVYLNINNNTLNELQSVIDYLKSKGYIMHSITELIDE
ncbi:MAG: hypothetical protein NC181_04485 [Clostridium sp.]|nr:hypothetical protein [Clostridium sp.]MCM1444504.1 hypothetical protein [Candidatus Amulumruptor caecigallinarius]